MSQQPQPAPDQPALNSRFDQYEPSHPGWDRVIAAVAPVAVEDEPERFDEAWFGHA